MILGLITPETLYTLQTYQKASNIDSRHEITKIHALQATQKIIHIVIEQIKNEKFIYEDNCCVNIMIMQRFGE